jgi:23S rRNA (pseudouridine1915-N3)-methyltransferase
MLKLKILTIGKTKDEWLDMALAEYTKRLKNNVSIEFCLAKTDAQLLELAEKEPVIICLDPKGLKLTSEQFADYLNAKFIEGGARLGLVIGGSDGLPSKLKKSKNLISFSDLTMTHQIIRLVLVEQVYRAFEILKNSKYHK